MPGPEPEALRLALDAAPLLGHPTGVGAFTGGLLTALAARADVEVRAYALSGRGHGALAGVLPAGVTPVARPMPARPLLALWRHADRPRLETWTGPVDVVHGTNFVVPPTRRAAAVVTVHDLTSIRFPQMCTPTTLTYPALVARAIGRGAHVHVHTAAVADEVRAHFAVEAARVHVVAPGVPPVAEVDPGTHPGPYVLALGTIEPRKDHVTLLRAFDLLADEQPDLHLRIAGSLGWGPEPFQQALAATRHRDRVHVLGRVDDRERAALLRGAAVLAYPSVYEGFGLPPLEAMSVGVPVVATDIAAVREVVAGAAALVPPADAEALAGTLALTLTDSTERARLVGAGHVRAASFTWERTADGLLGVLRSAVGQR
jgi:glycosyltransferase involved in cell wall biosynthesis